MSKPGTCTANNVQVTLAKPLDASKNPQKSQIDSPDAKSDKKT